ncbi:MAG: protease SohB [Pseudomonadota bacterium]
MTEWVGEYFLFLFKTATAALALVWVIGALLSVAQRHKKEDKGELIVESLNEIYDKLRDTIEENVYDEDVFEERKKVREKDKNSASKNWWQRLFRFGKDKKSHSEILDPAKSKPRVFVLEYEGDMRASGIDELERMITAILQVASGHDEVVLKLESGGGMVHAYGLASAELARFKNKNIRLTVIVDRVAASGGYMMACIADHLIAAPFAIVGSIGVVAQIPNFNRLLKSKDVDVEVHTAGEYKRTLTMFGENTEEGRRKFREELQETHDLFKEFVQYYRPQLSLDLVATGEHWYGTQALSLKLIDEVATSSEYLFEASNRADLYKVRYEIKRTLSDRMGMAMRLASDRLMSILNRS